MIKQIEKITNKLKKDNKNHPKSVLVLPIGIEKCQMEINYNT